MGGYALNNVLRAEVRPEVGDLPGAQTNEREEDEVEEVLHPLVSALVGVAQLLLAQTHVLGVLVELGHALAELAQLHLGGLQLLGSLVRVPVARVGANLHIELNRALARRSVAGSLVETVGEADIERGVGRGRESLVHLVVNVVSESEAVSLGVGDLHRQLLAVVLVAVGLHLHDHQRLGTNEVAHAAGVAVSSRLQIELQTLHHRKKQEKTGQNRLHGEWSLVGVNFKKW